MSISETLHAGGFMLSGNPDGSYISVDQATMKSGQAALNAGTVLGKIVTATATETHAGNTGTGAMGTITVADGAQAGIYRAVFVQAVTNAGNFEVFDPANNLVGTGLVGAVFTGGGLSFTIADSTDFVVGDKFLITVAVSATKWVQLAPTATDGSEVAAGILWDYTDASAADAQCTVVDRGPTEVNSAHLTWPGGITAGQKSSALAQLAKLGIIAR
jgi:hypothetical protein